MNIVNKKTGDTLFHCITSQGLEETRRYCEKTEFDCKVLEVSNNLKQRPLHIAVAARDASLVAYLLNKGCSVDAFKKGDWTSLMMASSLMGQEATKIAQLLISHGANCKLKNKDGWTSMHLACKHDNIDIVQLLAYNEPNLLLEPSRNGRLPIHIAALNGHASIVSLLINMCGTKICNIQDVCGTTPSMDAVSSGSIQVLEIIISKIKIQNQKDKFGLTCLHKASQMGHTEIVRYLLQQMRFDVNEQTTIELNTPLHLAVMEQKIDTIIVLLSHQANPNIRNKDNQTVLELPRGLKPFEINKLIEDYKV